MKKITSLVSASKQQYGTIVATLRDKHGNIKQHFEQPVDSFNRQMWRALQNNLANLSSGSLIGLTNLSTGNFGSLGNINFNGGINSYRGIVIGTGSSPTTIDTVIMGSIVDFGASAGQLFASEVTAEYDDATKIATFTRTFMSINEASSTINIQEVGLAGQVQSGDLKSNSCLYVRDVLSQAIGVSYEEALTIQYKIRLFNGVNNYSNIITKALTIVPGSATVANTTGNLITFSVGTSPVQGLTTSEGDATKGMIFGTSTTAFDPTQVNLQAKINHGNGSGELFYHPHTNSTIFENTTANSISFLHFRTVENRSASAVTINEVGLLIKATDQTNISNIRPSFLIDRAVLSNAQTINAGDSATFTWEFCYVL